MRLRFGTVAGALTLLLTVGTAAQGGQPRFSIDGTRTGSIKCKGLSNGAKDKFLLVPTMRIAQSAFDVGIDLDFGGGSISHYVGLANPGAKKPEKGELVIVSCGTDDQVGVPTAPDELGRMSISSKPGRVKASFKGTTIFSNLADPGPLPAAGYTCKWKFVRTSFDGGDGVDTSCDQSKVVVPLAP